jgi:hypothetical protein
MAEGPWREEVATGWVVLNRYSIPSECSFVVVGESIDPIRKHFNDGFVVDSRSRFGDSLPEVDLHIGQQIVDIRKYSSVSCDSSKCPSRGIVHHATNQLLTLS